MILSKWDSEGVSIVGLYSNRFKDYAESGWNVIISGICPFYFHKIKIQRGGNSLYSNCSFYNTKDNKILTFNYFTQFRGYDYTVADILCHSVGFKVT